VGHLDQTETHHYWECLGPEDHRERCEISNQKQIAQNVAQSADKGLIAAKSGADVVELRRNCGDTARRRISLMELFPNTKNAA